MFDSNEVYYSSAVGLSLHSELCRYPCHTQGRAKDGAKDGANGYFGISKQRNEHNQNDNKNITKIIPVI